MSKGNQLIVHLNNSSYSPIYWCYKAGNDPAIEGILENEDQLPELQIYAKDSQLTLAIPAQYVLIREVCFKGKYSSSRMEVLAWQLEEFCLGDMDQMHLTLLGRTGERYMLAAVDKKILRQWIDILSLSNLYPECIIPDALLLPDVSPNWSMAKLGDTWLVRESNHRGFCIADNELSLWLSQYSELPAIQCYSPVSESMTGNIIESIEPTMPLLIQGLINNRVNLLHGEFSTKPKFKMQKYYCIISLLAICYAMIFLFESVLQTFNTQQRTKNIKQQTQQLYHQHLPEKILTNTPRLQLLEDIALLEKSTVDLTFISLLSQAYPLFSTFTPGEVQSMSYRSLTETLSFVIATRKTPLMQIKIPNLVIATDLDKKNEDGLITFTIRKEQ